MGDTFKYYGERRHWTHINNSNLKLKRLQNIL